MRAFEPLRLYQTLENKENPEEIEEHGPYKGDKSAAWLGLGYYFWDYHIELGHWWGTHRYGQSRYIICGADAEVTDALWDWVAKGKHRAEFRRFVEELEADRTYPKNKLYVGNVVMYLLKTKSIKYGAIRAHSGEHTVGFNYKDPKLFKTIKFVDSHHAKMEFIPPIQVCLFDKTAISLRNYLVVFPDYLAEPAEFA